MNLYVGNLASDVSEDDLRQAFEAFGEVESVSIIKDRFSGESRGFGFVRMPSRDEALKAIDEAQGMDIKGQTIKVSEAHQQSGGQSGGHGRERGRGRERGSGCDERGDNRGF